VNAVGSPKPVRGNETRSPSARGKARERVGLLAGGLCASCAAFIPAVARLTTEVADPIFVAVASTLFGAAAAAAVLGVRGELRGLLRTADAANLALIGLLGTAIPFFLFFVGTHRTSAIEAVLCLQTEPAYSLLLAWLVLGHRLTVRRVGAATLLLAGIFLAVGTGGGGDALGIAALITAPLCWQLSHLVVLRRLPHVAPRLLTGARYVYGGLLLAPALFWIGGDAIPAAGALRAQLPLLAFQGVVLAYLGTMCWYTTIARIDLARATAIVVPSIPVLSLVVSFALVGEVPSARQAVGVLVIVAGVLAFVRAPHAVETRERVPTATAPLAVAADPEIGGDQA
jgi:drug/metabolite transporter (DMT)-like permease